MAGDGNPIILRLEPGTPTEFGLWCDTCQLPSAVRVPVNILFDSGVCTMSTVLVCPQHKSDES